MLRPGRVDTVIEVTPPDAQAATKLVKHYGRDIIDPKADLVEVGEMLAGQIPAIIREAVERSKLAAMRDIKEDEELVVTAEHLSIAARQMLEHAKLLEEPEDEKPDLVILGEAIGGILTKGMRYKDYDAPDDDNSPDKENLGAVPSELLDKAGRPKKNGSVRTSK